MMKKIGAFFFGDSFSDKSIPPQRMSLKKGIWLYYILLIFEGALRKWFLPGLATPLLVVRDPIAIWLVIKSIQYGYLPKNGYVITAMIIGIISIFTALLFGHGNFFVALFGARVFLFHFPLIFLIGKVFNRNDVLNIAKFTLLISIVLAVIVAMQFYSPQSAWINVGVGGDEAGSGFSGALGYLRPSGVFSFTNGNTLFFSYLACYILFFLVTPGIIKPVVLVLATIGLLMVIPFSISRSLLFSVVISFVFCLIAVSRKPQYLGKMLGGIVAIVLVLGILSQAEFFNTAVEVFTARFTSANEVEGGLDKVLLDRYLGGILGALLNVESRGFWGGGIGLGSNVGSMLMGQGVSFLLPEGEWGKLIGELGPMMGLTVIFLRVTLTIELAFKSYKSLVLGNLLPWMLLSFGILNISQGQWKQPTGLGFTIIIAGFIAASLNVPKQKVIKTLS